MVEIPQLWQLIAGAGPLGVAAVLFVALYFERKRADDERQRNGELSERAYKGLSDAAEGVRAANELSRATNEDIKLILRLVDLRPK